MPVCRPSPGRLWAQPPSRPEAPATECGGGAGLLVGMLLTEALAPGQTAGIDTFQNCVGQVQAVAPRGGHGVSSVHLPVL